MVAYAGEPLLRGSLEAWAHLYWIEYGETRQSRVGKRFASRRGSRHCFSDNRQKWSTQVTRALCWRMGDAISYHKNVSDAGSPLKDPRATRHSRRDRDRISKLHKLSGCPGIYGRDYRDVAPMLALMGRKNHQPWVPVLWHLYSGSSHQTTPLRLIGSSNRSAWDGMLPDWERRALLSRTVTVFLMAYQHVINLSTNDITCLQTFASDVADANAVPLMAELNALPIPQQ